MKINGKAIKIIAAVILVLWIALCIVNIKQVEKLQEPFMAWRGGEDKKGNITYFGVGFSFVAELDEAGEIAAMEMYIFGIRAVSAIR